MYLTRINTPAYPRRWDWLFDRFFNDTLGSMSDLSSEQATFVPKVDVAEDEAGYHLHVAVPGLKKENFKLEIHDGRLTISGERKLDAEKKDKTWHVVESSYGMFSRVFRIPEDANVAGIEATYADGVLSVRLPKDEAKKAVTRVEVK